MVLVDQCAGSAGNYPYSTTHARMRAHTNVRIPGIYLHYLHYLHTPSRRVADIPDRRSIVRRRDHFISKPPASKRCPKCRRGTLVGLVDGITERVDAKARHAEGGERAFVMLLDGSLARYEDPVPRMTYFVEHSCPKGIDL
jgi:hypothetical protein